MKTISIVNLKGGVGKTITAVNLAYILAADYKKRVLLIDADHQGNASRFYKASTQGETVAELIDGTCTNYPLLIQHTVYRNLDIIPADMRLSRADLAGVSAGKISTQSIINLRDSIIEDDAYDFIIIDCPPAFSAASVSAIAASSDIIIPIKLDAFSIDGMSEIEQQIEDLRRRYSSINIAGCLITMFDRSDASRQGEQWLRETSAMHIFKTHIRNTPKIVESTFSRVPIVEWSEQCGASRDYRAFVDEFLFGGNKNGK